MILLPVMLQTLLGYPSIQAGWALAPRGFGSAVGMAMVGAISARLDPRKLLAVGLAGAGGTLFWFGSLNLQAGYWDYFWPQLVQGFAMAFLFVPLTTLTMDGIRPEAMGNATSLYNLIRNVGGGVGIAMATTLVSRFGQVNMQRLSEHVDMYGAASTGMLRQMTQAFIARGGDPVMAQQQALAVLYGVTQRQASMLSFIQMFRLLGLVLLALIPLILLLRRPRYHNADLDVMHTAEI